MCSRGEATGERGTTGRGRETEGKGVGRGGEIGKGKEGSGRDKSRRVRKQRNLAMLDGLLEEQG